MCGFLPPYLLPFWFSSFSTYFFPVSIEKPQKFAAPWKARAAHWLVGLLVALLFSRVHLYYL